jgi:hypothetical protein
MEGSWCTTSYLIWDGDHSGLNNEVSVQAQLR